MCFSPIIYLTIAAGISIWPATTRCGWRKQQFGSSSPDTRRIPFTTMARSFNCFTVTLALWF